MRRLKLVVIASTMQVGRASKLDRVFCRDKPVPRQESRFRLPAIPSGASILEERGYCFFPDAEVAGDAAAVSFLYSALAWRSIGIFGSASFQVVKKSS